MSKQLVLITGATGHIGFRTLVEVLSAGYRARITTRKIAQIEKIKAAKSIQPFVDDLEYQEVPDITAPGAFDDAVIGVDFVLHLASPIPDLSSSKAIDVKKDFLDPAKEGTLSILRSAANSTTIKRIVITSSIVVLAPQQGSSKITSEFVLPAPDPEKVEADPWTAYRASKTLAYHAAQDWVTVNKPYWDLIYVLPAYVQGRNELVTKWQDVGNGSNDIMIGIVTGKQQAKPRLSSLVWVNDVARLEVATLDTSKGRNGDRFVASFPKPVTWSEVPPIAARLFPEAVNSGVLVNENKQESTGVFYDSAPTTVTFGIEFAGPESMVESLVGQYVQLKGEA